MINGDVSVVGNITVGTGGSITGARNDTATAVTFPNVATKLGAKMTEAKGRPSSYWTNPQTALVVNSAVIAAETVDANTVNYGSGPSP